MSIGSSWGKKQKKILRKLIRGCSFQGCTQTKSLQFAHLRPTGLSGRSRGLNRRMKDILEHPNDYVLLCRYHHNLLDSGLLPSDN